MLILPLKSYTPLILSKFDGIPERPGNSQNECPYDQTLKALGGPLHVRHDLPYGPSLATLKLYQTSFCKALQCNSTCLATVHAHM